jgi:threonylcarbamoyladenosine tRNA methylthiotransferase MtaB
MRRRYSANQYRDAVGRIRAAVPGVAITTDVIAAFPGETDDDFADTLRLCDELSLSRIHAFPYSPRSQTAAVRMPGQLSPAIKKERMAALGALSTELQRRHIDAHRGKGRPVLWEHQVDTPAGLHWRGYTDNYIPAYAASEEALHNRITHAVVKGPFEDGALTGFTGALGT